MFWLQHVGRLFSENYKAFSWGTSVARALSIYQAKQQILPKVAQKFANVTKNYLNKCRMLRLFFSNGLNFELLPNLTRSPKAVTCCSDTGWDAVWHSLASAYMEAIIYKVTVIWTEVVCNYSMPLVLLWKQPWCKLFRKYIVVHRYSIVAGKQNYFLSAHCVITILRKSML